MHGHRKRHTHNTAVLDMANTYNRELYEPFVVRYSSSTHGCSGSRGEKLLIPCYVTAVELNKRKGERVGEEGGEGWKRREGRWERRRRGRRVEKSGGKMTGR